MRKKILTKTNKEWIALAIIMLSTSIVIFNNIGQSFQLIELNLSKENYYWIAGISFFIGSVWTLYLNKIIKL
jgi:hypothetical protein